MAKQSKKSGSKPSIADHPRWEAVIGLEVHVQLKTATKMFCRCPNRFGERPNSLTCPVCLGMPGSLPVINARAIEFATMAGLAFDCEIASYTKFDRKNYFYPDLPKGYQISQFDLPICSGGGVQIDVGGKQRTIGLVRIHLEEDAGKNIHVEGESYSRVDLNRAGVPLLEIVSQPQIHSGAEAADYMRRLRLTMLYLGISDCNMEEGSLRCDCNISIRPRGESTLGTRAEVKNINSFSFVETACEYEIGRQIQLREAGREIVQETRLFDSTRNETRSMRGKEEAHDYRYFPEPDLQPVRIQAPELQELRERLPPLPDAVAARLRDELGLPAYDSEILLQDPDVVAYFERCLELYSRPKKVANWIINDVFQEMNERKVGVGELEELGLGPRRLVSLIEAVEQEKVSVASGREVLKRMVGNEQTVDALIESMGVGMISDDGMIVAALEEAMAAHPGVVEDVRSGKGNARNFFVGQVMKATRGKANPAQVMKLIDEKIG